MALNKLQKWIGSMLFSAFMNEYNDNVDATNAAIDAVEANTSLIDFSSSLTPIDGVTDLRAYKVGRVHFLSFNYKPTQTGFTDAIAGIPSAYRPSIHIAGSVATQQSSADANRDITVGLRTSGLVRIATTTLPGYGVDFTFTWIV